MSTPIRWLAITAYYSIILFGAPAQAQTINGSDVNLTDATPGIVFDDTDTVPFIHPAWS